MTKKIWFISTPFLILGLSFLIHNLYKIYPSFLTSLLFPVNESIFEHNKLIIFSFLIVSIIDYKIFKNSNVFINYFLSSIICLMLVILFFSPLYFFIWHTKDNLFITILIYFIAICGSQLINYKLRKKEYKTPILGLIFFLITYLILGLLSFYPLKNPLFYDYQNDQYGIVNNFLK